MSFETQKNFLGKTQTIIMAEMQSERWLSWVRLGIAVVYTAIAFISFLIGKTNFQSFSIQIFAVLLLIAYSSYYLFHYSRKLAQGYFVYILIFFDVAVITCILWSYSLSEYSFLTNAIYGAYFIVITFTALHHRISLSLFCGIVSVLGYSALFFIPQHSFDSIMFNDYIVRVVLLMAVAGLSGIISRNNSRTIQQVVSSEIRYHNLVHRLPEMLFTLDGKGNFLWSNIASHAILGIPSKVIAGRSLKSFLISSESFKLDKLGVKGTFEINDFNGNRKFVACIIQATEDESGNAAYEGLMADVTDRELAISQREEMVNRLFQYQKMESLGTLASGMAHDFNNILQTVNDLTTMVERESNEAGTKKRMNVIIDTLKDAKFLISELLAIGRKKPLDYKTINICNFLGTIIPQFSDQIGNKYSVTFEAPDEPLWVQGDGDYLKRVFQNLFGNSRDAMPEGGKIVVSCSCEKSEPDNELIVLRFSDTGSGIPAELTEKIFDPFFTTKKPGKGTGLGLALVRRIMMLHHGNIFVEQTGLNGTTFKMEFPVSDAGEADSDTKAILMNRLSSTVLLLDDDPKIMEVLKFFLKEFHYPVLEASASLEANTVLKSRHLDCKVLIMDWKLGNEDPHEIIRSLRAINKNLIVIVVSGYSPNVKSIESMNIHKWFTKPYDKNQLDIEIQRALYYLQTAMHDKS